MKRRFLQKRHTRHGVVHHAMRLCARRGFAALRTLDVTRAAGLSHGALFVHFSTRERLLREVVSQLGREITDELHRMAASGACLRDVLAAHLACLGKREDLYRQFLLAGPLQAPGFRRGWIGIQSAIASHMEPAITREIAAGRARAIPLHLLFNTWLGLVHHYILNKDLFSPSGSVLTQHGAQLIRHFLRLLSKTEESA